ncbi:hypothetical protein GCM10025777_14510 [Membranihabitans marinus]
MHYLIGCFMLALSILLPNLSQAQDCLQNARDKCAETTSLTVQLNNSNQFVIALARDFFNDEGLPSGCSPNDFMLVVNDISATPDTVLTDEFANYNFRISDACQYVGQRMTVSLMYVDGNNMFEVCTKPVYLLPNIICLDTTLYCSDAVFSNPNDPTIYPVQFSCSGMNELVTSTLLGTVLDTVGVDTLFRTWEVTINNGKGVLTCEDTIIKEAIPSQDVLEHLSDIEISCDLWSGEAPDPSISGYPYFVVGLDTFELNPDAVDHSCASVSFNDVALGSFNCEQETYLRYWQVRTEDFIWLDTQEISIIDESGPTGEFRAKAVDSMLFIGEDLIERTIPIFEMSTGQHDCLTDGVLPLLYASDGCSSVARVDVTTTVNGISRNLVNGGPFVGYEQGKYVIKYSAYDECWNESIFYIAIQVVDRQNPVAVFGDLYNVTLTGYEVTWLNVEDFVEHKVFDNCEIELVVARRMNDHATACGADDPTSAVGMYKAKYAQWLAEDSWGCADEIDPADGWMDKVPLCCEDIGQDVMIEILIFDKACNMARAMTTLNAVDKGVVTIVEELEDVSLACEAWDSRYESLIFPNGRDAGADIDSLNKYFGTYESYIPGNPVEPTAYTIYDEDCTYDSMNDTLIKTPVSFELWGGKMLSICGEAMTQTAELTFDETCNTFTIERNFIISGNTVAVQNISTEIKCPFVDALFDYPEKVVMITIADSSILYDDAYWSANRFNYETEAPVYNGSDCRVLAMGYFDKLMDMISSQNPNEAEAVIIRTWCMADWCSTDIPSDWKSSPGRPGILTYEQHIKIFYDEDQPDVSLEDVVDPVDVTDGIDETPPNTDKSMVEVSGRIHTEDALNVFNVKVNITNDQNKKEMVTNESGSFEALIEKGSSLKITPEKSGELSNGISTLDLILIQQHLLQKRLIQSPYKLIAADVNNDRSLSPADLLLLRKVILGQETGLDVNSAWKFVNADYQFINVKAAYSENYPSEIKIHELSTDLNSDFVAVKIGDVNSTANVSRSTSRSNFPTKTLQIQNKNLNMGDEWVLPITLSELDRIQGMQFALQYNSDEIEVLDINSDQLNITNDQVKFEDGMLKLSWSDINYKALQSDNPTFYLTVKAKRDVAIQDVFAINSTALSPEVYDESQQEYSLALEYKTAKINNDLTVLQNRPNPTNGETVIDYSLDRNALVRLMIRDVTGKIIYTNESNSSSGWNQFRVQTQALNPGVYYYSITDGIQVATKKMVVIK